MEVVVQKCVYIFISIEQQFNLSAILLQFVYVNQAFAPSPDQNVGNLCECFGSDGKLVLYYSKTQAWG
jgi:hypothetical protein